MKKIVSLLLVLMMVFSLLPMSALAAEEEATEEITEDVAEVTSDEMTEETTEETAAEAAEETDVLETSVFVCSLDGEIAPDAGDTPAVVSSGAAVALADFDAAVAYVRGQMVARAETISFSFVQVMEGLESEEDLNSSASSVLQSLMDAALAHTGTATEGDYLSKQLHSYKAGANIAWLPGSSEYTLSPTIQLVYYTTASQEKAVTSKIKEVMASFAFTSSTSEYQKVKAICDYICENVTYDEAHYQQEIANKSCADPLPHSTYAALMEGKAVCQGYATLFYRMALEAGIDARVITGLGNGGAHAWNIVKLGDRYYNIDVTWFDSAHFDSCFLSCDENFVDHKRDAEYASASFYAAYPMASEDYEPDPAISLADASVTIGVATGGDVVVIVKRNGETLTENTDYIFTSGKDATTGMISVTVTGRDAYTGEITETLKHTPGDMDGKDGVTILDVLTLLKAVAGITGEPLHADVNGDGSMTILDVLALLKYVAGISGSVIF